MTKKLYITFALLGSLLITSCDSFLDIQPIGKYMLNSMGINVKEAGSDNISGLFCGRRVDRGTTFFLC